MFGCDPSNGVSLIIAVREVTNGEEISGYRDELDNASLVRVAVCALSRYVGYDNLSSSVTEYTFARLLLADDKLAKEELFFGATIKINFIFPIPTANSELTVSPNNLGFKSKGKCKL